MTDKREMVKINIENLERIKNVLHYTQETICKAVCPEKPKTRQWYKEVLRRKTINIKDLEKIHELCVKWIVEYERTIKALSYNSIDFLIQKD